MTATRVVTALALAGTVALAACKRDSRPQETLPKLTESMEYRFVGNTAKGFDTDLVFMAAEIVGDEMYFNAISRTGQIVDSGVITHRKVSP